MLLGDDREPIRHRPAAVEKSGSRQQQIVPFWAANDRWVRMNGPRGERLRGKEREGDSVAGFYGPRSATKQTKASATPWRTPA